jgi:hypothetical protein
VLAAVERVFEYKIARELSPAIRREPAARHHRYSLVATDHINNPNTINAIFEVNARLDRAAVNDAD